MELNEKWIKIKNTIKECILNCLFSSPLLLGLEILNSGGREKERFSAGPSKRSMGPYLIVCIVVCLCRKK